MAVNTIVASIAVDAIAAYASLPCGSAAGPTVVTTRTASWNASIVPLPSPKVSQAQSPNSTAASPSSPASRMRVPVSWVRSTAVSCPAHRCHAMRRGTATGTSSSTSPAARMPRGPRVEVTASRSGATHGPARDATARSAGDVTSHCGRNRAS